MPIRTLVASLLAASLLAVMLATPVAAQPGQPVGGLCDSVADRDFFLETCVGVVEFDRGTDELLSIAERHGNLVDLERYTEEVSALLGAGADDERSREAVDDLDLRLTGDVRLLGRLMTELDEWLASRRQMRDSLGWLRELAEKVAPDVAVVLGTVPLADVRAEVTRGEELREAMVETLVALEELRFGVSQAVLGLGKRTPEPDVSVTDVTFDGVWSSEYGEEIVLTQSGFVVTGTYDLDGGRVEFEVRRERVLDGYWAEEGSREECDGERLGSEHWGRLQLTFSSDLSAYEGVWGYCDEEPVIWGWDGSYLRPRDTQAGDGE